MSPIVCAKDGNVFVTKKTGVTVGRKGHGAFYTCRSLLKLCPRKSVAKFSPAALLGYLDAESLGFRCVARLCGVRNHLR